MKVAVTVWNERVAPVFDNSRQCILFEYKDNRKNIINTIMFKSDDVEGKVKELFNFGIDFLICGAIPRRVEYLLVNGGCNVIPFIAGDIKEVINEFSQSGNYKAKFKMPGCGRRKGQGYCQRYHGNRNN